jgi:hypothetical protein
VTLGDLAENGDDARVDPTRPKVRDPLWVELDVAVAQQGEHLG